MLLSCTERQKLLAFLKPSSSLLSELFMSFCRWQFVTVDSLESGAACEPDSHSAQAQDHTTDQNADILAAPASGSKRKAEVSPPSVKRQRGSDGGSWALEQNAKLRQELQVRVKP